MAINDYDNLILGAAQQYNVDPQLLKATMQVESGGNQNDPKTGKINTSSAGAQGLMQFIPSTAKQYGVDVNDPRSSIFGAAHYLSDLLTQYGNPDTALDHYSGNTPGYGQKIVAAYKQVAAPVASSSPTSAAPSVPPGLAAVLQGKTPPQVAPPAAAGTAPPGLQKVLDQPPSQTQTQPPIQGDRLTAVGAGLHQAVSNIANAPSAWFGWNPLMDPKLSPTQQASAEQYPITTGISRVGGELGLTAPLIIPAVSALPEAGALSLPLLAARGVGVGMLTGGAQAGLTAGERFEPGASQENPLVRIGKGALYGAPFGALGGGAEWALGAGETIAPEIQRAGQQMVGDGVDVTAANLPRAGAPAGTLGAPAAGAQVGQINRAWGNIIGESTPDFAPGTLNRVIPKLGQDVGNAVKAGKINYDAVLSDGRTFEQHLADIEANTDRPQVKNLINSIVGKVGGANEITGDDVGELLRTGNPLDKATRSRIPEISDPANEIESAMHEAFGVSSPQGASNTYTLARERYKLALTGERAANETTGNIDPGKLMTAIRQMYPDAKRLGTGTGMTDRAVNFARNANQLFGGSAPASSASEWTVPALLTAAGSGVMHYMPVIGDNPLLAGAAAGVPLAGRAINRFVQSTPAFARNLLTRGPSGFTPYAPAFAGSGAVSTR